jgi:hypothetical protein
MRMGKSSLGERKKIYYTEDLLNPRKKYFLAYEGEATEFLYFSGIFRIKEKLKIKSTIQLIPLKRNHLHRSWSHPKKIFEIIKPFMDNLKNNKLSINDLIETIVGYCFEYSEDITNKKDCDDLREYINNILVKDFKLTKNCFVPFNSNEVEKLVESLNKKINEKIFINQLSPYIKLHFESYVPDIDEVCLIVDRDKNSFTEDQYDTMIENCKKNNYKLFVSNPCFEFWLLLHFDEIFKIDKEKLKQNEKVLPKASAEPSEEINYSEFKLREVLNEFRKNNIYFDKLEDKVLIAIENSKKFETDLVKLKDNIGSNIGLLLEELIN